VALTSSSETGDATRRPVEEPVLVVAVLAESLAVVRGHDEPRVLEHPPLRQRVEHLLNHRIHVVDLVVVRIDRFDELQLAIVERDRRVRDRIHRHRIDPARLYRGAQRRVHLEWKLGAIGTRVGRVHVVVVKEQEERLAVPALHPTLRRSRDVGTRDLAPAAPAPVARVPPRLEPACHSALGIERQATDEARGGVAGLAKPLRQRRERSLVAPAIREHLVPARVDARHECHVGGQRMADHRERLLEHRGRSCDPVEVGRRRARIAVQREVIGSERVDDDQDDVRRAGRGGRPWLRGRVFATREKTQDQAQRRGVAPGSEKKPLAPRHAHPRRRRGRSIYIPVRDESAGRVVPKGLPAYFTVMVIFSDATGGS
jgi:hypothetical protein